jgi:hypothetical protein
MNDEAERFWTQFEAETGEKVEAKSIGTWYEGPEDRGIWGLLVITDRSFRFKYVPSDNWLASLIKPRGALSGPRKDADIAVSKADLLSLEEPRRGFMARLFGPVFPRFTLAWSEEGKERQESFSVDPAGDFLARLKEFAPLRRG